MTVRTRPKRAAARSFARLLAPLLGAALLACPARAEPAPLLPPLQSADDAARCVYFDRLHNFAEQSKALCEDGRDVKPGPVTRQELAQCRASQGPHFGQAPVRDLMDRLAARIAGEGVGNACHDASIQVWDLVTQ